MLLIRFSFELFFLFLFFSSISVFMIMVVSLYIRIYIYVKENKKILLYIFSRNSCRSVNTFERYIFCFSSFFLCLPASSYENDKRQFKINFSIENSWLKKIINFEICFIFVFFENNWVPFSGRILDIS
jgi:hypothetical protein